jgi:hypothetical protein
MHARGRLNDLSMRKKQADSDMAVQNLQTFSSNIIAGWSSLD